MRSLILFAIGLAVAALCVTEGDANMQGVCDNINDSHGVIITAIRLFLKRLEFQDVFTVIERGQMVHLTLGIETVKIVGLEDIYFGLCEEVDGDVTITLVMDSVDIELINYNMTGDLAGTLDVDGYGNGSMALQNFSLVLNGPLITDPDLHFDEVHANLELWKWIVIFDGFMPGTDMEYLFNEFMSMVGPELIEAFEVRLNNEFAEQLVTLCNKILERGGWGGGTGSHIEG